MQRGIIGSVPDWVRLVAKLVRDILCEMRLARIACPSVYFYADDDRVFQGTLIVDAVSRAANMQASAFGESNCSALA